MHPRSDGRACAQWRAVLPRRFLPRHSLPRRWLPGLLAVVLAAPAAAVQPHGGPSLVLRGTWALTHVDVDASATADGKERRDATIVVVAGKVSCVGACPLPAGIDAVDGRGARVWPGFVEVASDLGQMEVSAEPSSHDGAPTGLDNAAHVRARDGIVLDSRVIEAARWGGVAVAIVRPMGRTLVAGTSAAFRTGGATVEAAMLREGVAVHVQLGDVARVADRPMVASRSGQIGLLRTLLRAAAETTHRPATATHDVVPRGLERSTDAQGLLALAGVVGGSVPLVVHAHRAEDIAAALGLVEEFGLKLVIQGGAEAWVLAEALARARVPVVLTPARARPMTFEVARARDDAAVVLTRAGVAVGIASGRTHEVRNLRWEAGALVRLGLARDLAWAAITTVPLAAYGLRPELGARVGQAPTFSVMTGDPLGLDGRLQAVAVGDALEVAPSQR